MHKGQTTLVVMVLAIIIFIILGLFFLTSSMSRPKNVSEYYNMYAHNLLLSITRADTGYGGICKSFADVGVCAITRNGMCGSVSCRDILSNDLKVKIDSIIKPDIDYVLIIEPENWELIGGERIVIGNQEIMNYDEKWAANEKILRKGENINIRLFIAPKQ